MGRIKQSENCNHLGKFARKTKPSSLVLKYKKVKQIRNRTEANMGRANKNPGFKSSILTFKKMGFVTSCDLEGFCTKESIVEGFVSDSLGITIKT